MNGTGVVVGAGVIGLAVGAELARRGLEVYVLESLGLVGSVTSSRNSEVVHAGMYYPPGSMKARHCVAGRRELYDYCERHGVPHRRCGKLIVAVTEEEAAQLEAIAARGAENGVEDLTLLSGAQARAMEPALSCAAALHSGQTGIIDSHAYMLSLRKEIEANHGWVVLNTPTLGARRDGGRWAVEVGGDEPTSISADILVNAAGLSAWDVAVAIEGYPRERLPSRALAKGSYFRYSGRPAFSRLIYPAPVDGGLGVHVTLDLAGQMRFGPDVEWTDTVDYAVDAARAEGFYDAIRRYWPGLPDGSLVPDYSGYRPKLGGPGTPTDFALQGPETHGQPGLVQMFGIESPGLTSSPSLSRAVADLVVPGLA